MSNPKERPILFSTDMVQAILDGRKTETRRVAKKQPTEKHAGLIRSILLDGTEREAWLYLDKEGKAEAAYCPYGQTGDLLWVRETFAHNKQSGLNHEDENYGYVYRATDPYWETDEGWKWKPSIFMPKDAARIWLQVTYVCLQKLQKMTAFDARAEGIDRLTYWDPNGDEYTYPCFVDKKYEHPNAIDCFKTLWESINGPDSWEKNPYVWVVKFKVLSTTGKPDTWPNKQLRVDEEAEKYGI